MRIYQNVSELVAMNPGTPWQRVAEAYEQALQLPVGPAYSIGDSLTYRICDEPDEDPGALMHRLQYASVLIALSGEITVRIARRTALRVQSGYDDSADQAFLYDPTGLEEYTGECVLGVGEVGVVDPHFAFAVEAVRGQYLRAYVTLAGCTLNHD